MLVSRFYLFMKVESREREFRGNTQFTWELLRIPLSSNINSGSCWLQSVWFCRLPSCTSWWFLCRYVPGSPWRYRCPLPSSTTRLHMYVWMNGRWYVCRSLHSSSIPLMFCGSLSLVVTGRPDRSPICRLSVVRLKLHFSDSGIIVLDFGLLLSVVDVYSLFLEDHLLPSEFPDIGDSQTSETTEQERSFHDLFRTGSLNQSFQLLFRQELLVGENHSGRIDRFRRIGCQ